MSFLKNFLKRTPNVIKPEKTDEPQFIRTHLEGNAVYEIYKGVTAETAKLFLNTKKVDKRLYCIVVETPEGNWGVDIEGLYLEHLLPWQTNVSLAEVEGTIEPYNLENPFGLKMAANGANDNFLARVLCGKCNHNWIDGIRYQNITVVKCPNCKTYNRVDSTHITLVEIQSTDSREPTKMKQPDSDLGASPDSPGPVGILEVKAELTERELWLLNHFLCGLTNRLDLKIDSGSGIGLPKPFPIAILDDKYSNLVTVECSALQPGTHIIRIVPNKQRLDKININLAQLIQSTIPEVLSEAREIQRIEEHAKNEKMSPQAEELWNNGIAMMDRSPDEALRLFEEVLKIDPAQAKAYGNILYVYRYLKKDPVRAINIGKDIIKKHPSAPSIANQMGMAYLDTGSFDKALEMFLLVRLEEAEVSTLGCLTIMYELLGDKEKALRSDMLFMMKAPNQAMVDSIRQQIHQAYRQRTSA